MDEYGNVFSYDLKMGPILIICKDFYLETTVKEEEKGIFVDPINSTLTSSLKALKDLLCKRPRCYHSAGKTVSREDLRIEPNSFFSDFSDSLNLLNSLNF